ncbi:N-6 DNA methylase [Acidiphilium iwatense]|nr:N-6 DNA methylase [Acidiphilium iwatense]
MTRLAARPGHEAVRTLIGDILRNGFGIAWSEIDHEVRLPRVHGRIDTMFAGTVFEFKRDLRQELGDVERKLPDYLAERERQTERKFLGIATDGATFIAYEWTNGALAEISRHVTRADQGPALLAWLEPALGARDDLPAEPLSMQRALGRDSMVFGHARRVLAALWQDFAGHPEVALKRQLWDGLLREVYGTPIGDDGLFLQHTYLTIIAKTIAAAIFELPATGPEAILSGSALAEAGIHGAVESDFFDWILLDQRGRDLVARMVGEIRRFRLQSAQTDVLKALYESLIDPAQRHDLGEYYTPDWLAAKLTRAVVTAPLTQRVLDPACGSGTFLFHAVRALLGAAEAAGWGRRDALRAACAQVHGMDVHPVAVIFARVTWLLALGPALGGARDLITVPVYLGDALQWNVVDLGDAQEVRVAVPNAKPLTIPGGFAEEQARFEPALQALTDGLAHAEAPATVYRQLRHIAGVTAQDAETLRDTYAHLKSLYDDGRDGIWPYVIRNLQRPLWLSKPKQRADVVLGNPPWVAFRFMSAGMMKQVREACKKRNLWVGGVLATQQDLSALFMARAVELYLKPGGRIGFVLPYAALNRPAYAGLRAGDFGTNGSLRITEAWSFDERVKPLFPVPASVIIGTRADAVGLPAQVTRYAGVLNRRDATEAEADKTLVARRDVWPPMPTLAGVSAYRARFRQGATIVPRRFFFVERAEAGRLGVNEAAPVVEGLAGALDKAPWNTLTPPRGPVENQFLRHVLLGESLAPFRLLRTPLAVIPADGLKVLDAKDAAAYGHIHLARWLRQTEAAWDANARKDGAGKPKMTLRQRLDHVRGLSLQLPNTGLRVVYAASGTLPSATIVENPEYLVEHKAYWTALRSRAEGQYLCAIINSEAARRRITDMQSKGQGGARDFDNLVWELRIPEYDRKIALHRALAAAAVEAESIAARVELAESAYFTTQRRAIRDALVASGVATKIDALVEQLLEG